MGLWVRALRRPLPQPAPPALGEPGPGFSDCGGGGREEGGTRCSGAPAPIRAAPAIRPGPSRLCSRTALPSARSLARFFSSAIFPLQSIAGNRMWVTQQHCFRLRKLPLLLPKGSGGARGCQCGCRSRGGTGGVRGGGHGCSPSHVPEDLGSGSGPLRLSQPLEVSGERGGPQPSQCGHRNKEGSANFAPESRQLQRRKVRQLATLAGWGGDAGTLRTQPGWEGMAGGDPCFPGGVPGWCSGSPLPSPSLGRARRCRVPGEACGELAGSPPLCVVPPLPQPRA